MLQQTFSFINDTAVTSNKAIACVLLAELPADKAQTCHSVLGDVLWHAAVLHALPISNQPNCSTPQSVKSKQQG